MRASHIGFGVGSRVAMHDSLRMTWLRAATRTERRGSLSTGASTTVPTWFRTILAAAERNPHDHPRIPTIQNIDARVLPVKCAVSTRTDLARCGRVGKHPMNDQVQHGLHRRHGLTVLASGCCSTGIAASKITTPPVRAARAGTIASAAFPQTYSSASAPRTSTHYSAPCCRRNQAV